MDNVDIIKPILKWVGGKSQIIHTLIHKFPNHMNNYHDIFVGGGSTLLALLSFVKAGKITVSNKIYAYDINPDLINMYQQIQSNPVELCIQIQNYINEYDKTDKKESFFYNMRSGYNSLTDEQRYSIIGSSMFIFLNKTCFRGLYRVGPNGFNVPFGNYKHINIEQEHILSISNLIKQVEFKCMNFEESLKTIQEGDFVYLDPPYVPIKDTSFVKYNLNGFNKQSHELLFSMCKNLTQKFIMSNSSAQFVIDSFSNYSIENIECKRKIHSTKPNTKVMEVIIKNF